MQIVALRLQMEAFQMTVSQHFTAVHPVLGGIGGLGSGVVGGWWGRLGGGVGGALEILGR